MGWKGGRGEGLERRERLERRGGLEGAGGREGSEGVCARRDDQFGRETTIRYFGSYIRPADMRSRYTKPPWIRRGPLQGV